MQRIKLDSDNARQMLRQSALSAASDELNVFFSAEQLLRALIKDDDVRFGQKGCTRRLTEASVGRAMFANLARVAPDGKVLCAGIASPSTVNASAFPWWNEARVRREFFVSGPLRSEALGKNVFLGVLPLTREDGTFDGTLNVAISIEWLTFVHSRQTKTPAGSIVALFDKSGVIVASNSPSVATDVFAGVTASSSHPDGMISVIGPNDELWSVSIAPMLRHDYYIGFAMKESDLSHLSYLSLSVDLLLPALMIILASLATWLATDRLVVRWIDVLSSTARAYGSGNFAPRAQAMLDAPREFRELDAVLSDMAQAIRERDKGLEEAVAQKDLLIKEIHHRVKNTLQIVMSLLNLQAKRLRDPNAREALEQARSRINALALAHRALYEFDLDGYVDLKPLLLEAIEHVRRSTERANLTVSVDFAPCRVSGDAAVPLMLFVNEAMSTAVKHSFAQCATGLISASLRPASDGRMALVIADDGEGFDSAQSDIAHSARLMVALARQVSGEMTMLRKSHDGATGNVVALNFAAHCKPLPEVA